MVDLGPPPLILARPAIVRPAGEMWAQTKANFLPGMAGVVGMLTTAGPTAVDVTAQGSASDAANLATYTFAAQALGAVNDYRRSVVGLYFRGAGSLTLTSVTLGGNAMTGLGTAAVNNTGGNTTYCRFFGLNTGLGTVLTAATDAAVVVNVSAPNADRCGIVNYRVIKNGTSLTPTDDGVSLVDDPTVGIDCEANGAILGLFGGSDNVATTVGWTNLTEDYDFSVENRVISSAHNEFASAQTGRNITVTPSAAVTVPGFTLIAIGNG